MSYQDSGFKGFTFHGITVKILGPVAQSVASSTADPGIVSLFLARSHTFVGIDHEIISTVILLLPLIQGGLLSVTSESICSEYWLTPLSSLPRKSVGR